MIDIIVGMSTEQEEEKKEYVDRDQSVTTVREPGTTVVETAPRTVVREPAAAVVATTAPASEHRESTVTKRNTNVGALAAMVIGIFVLFFGIYLIFTRIVPYVAYPWSLLAILVVALILIVAGVSLVKTRVS